MKVEYDNTYKMKVAMITEHVYGQLGFPSVVKTIHSWESTYEEELKKFDNQKMKNKGYKVYISEIKIDIVEDE